MKMILSLLMGFQQASAVPMFGETAGTIKEGMLTLYKDHENPNKVYFFPNSARFSKDSSGIPLFNFVYWNIEDAANGGAYFSMTTHLASNADQQAALDSFMLRNPQIEVAVLPIRSSTVGLETTAAAAGPLAQFFKEYNFPKFGPAADGEIGVNAMLTPTGAKAFKALLLNTPGGGLLNFQYCYKSQGYGPNMDASITVNMRRVYDYFQAGHSGGWGWFSWNISKVVETLTNEKAITIVMNGGDAKEWEYLEKISEAITKRLFVPELAANPSLPQAPGQTAFRFSGGSIHKEELQTEVWTWKRRDLQDLDQCTAIVLKDLENYRDQLVVSADGK